VIDAGDDVVVVIHATARARGTEMLVERDMHHVWTMREKAAIQRD
jgi:ketosteroid isomerase-like protein